jgi:hypothetical protein
LSTLIQPTCIAALQRDGYRRIILSARDKFFPGGRPSTQSGLILPKEGLMQSRRRADEPARKATAAYFRLSLPLTVTRGYAVWPGDRRPESSYLPNPISPPNPICIATSEGQESMHLGSHAPLTLHRTVVRPDGAHAQPAKKKKKRRHVHMHHVRASSAEGRGHRAHGGWLEAGRAEMDCVGEWQFGDARMGRCGKALVFTVTRRGKMGNTDHGQHVIRGPISSITPGRYETSHGHGAPR